MKMRFCHTWLRKLPRCHHCSSKSIVSFRRKIWKLKMFDEVINSSDVTLVVNDGSLKPDQSVCKFNQTGFCKFGQTCCKMHVNEMCNTPNCDKHMCFNRHPKMCKYFSQNGHCKRGQICAYSHIKSDTYVKVEETEKEVNLLKSDIELLKANILKSENHLLRDAVQNLKEIVTSNSNHIEGLKEEIRNMNNKFIANLKYSCDKCGKIFVSNKNLNIHMNKYHQEVMINYLQDQSLVLSPCSETHSLSPKSHHSSLPPATIPLSLPQPPLQSPVLFLHIPGKFKCEYCSKTFEVGYMLEEHMIVNHIDQENVTECYSCDEEFNVNSVIFHGYKVLWTRAIVGNGGRTMAICKACHNEISEIELSQ